MMKVLIVEDNSDMRRVLVNFIRPLCQTVYECSDGIDALRLYRECRPDWVLMDWQMEKMDGITASEQILSQFPNAHICMVTSFSDEELEKEAFKAGVEKFVPKENLLSLREILTS